MLKHSFFVGALSLFASLSVGGSVRAELTPLHHVDLSTSAKRSAVQHSTEAAQALIRGDYSAALAHADKGIAAAPNDPWPHYDRAVALGGLGRTDEAVAEYQEAQARFSPDDIWGRSVAIYGRGYLLSEHGACKDAARAFKEYAALVGDQDAQGAAQAKLAMKSCAMPTGPRTL